MSGAYLPRTIFVSPYVGFHQEIFCLSDGREITIYQIVQGGRVHHLDAYRGLRLEDEILEIMGSKEDQTEFIEAELLHILMLLKQELSH